MSDTFKTPKGTTLPILVLKGKDYLEVKYRLVWFREEHPNWSIQTQFISIADKSALAKATISDETGRIVSTSHKFENEQGFADFLEKAETGSIGRALALIGYGTQFCADELDEGARIVDSPAQRLPIGGISYVRPEQPLPGDGVPSTDYVVGFGKFRGWKLEQIQDLDSLRNYVSWLEVNAKKTGKPLSEAAVEFIRRADVYLGALETAPHPVPA